MLPLALLLAMSPCGQADGFDLTIDGQRAPSLGASLSPRFGWLVPPCDTASGAAQTAYVLRVFRDGEQPGAKAPAAPPVWDSGKVHGNASLNVLYGGPGLEGGAAYHAAVHVWRGGCNTASPAFSTPVLFVTALHGSGFGKNASFIGAGVNSSTFTIARRVVAAPAAAGVRRVLGFVTAQNTNACMLFNYRLYINGSLASAGPGRGEAPLANSDARFRSLPYVTVDLTPFFLSSAGGPTVLALQAMQFGDNAPAVLMQIDIHPTGTGSVQSWVTEDKSSSESANSPNGWKVKDADEWMRPNDEVDAVGIPGWNGHDERRCPGARARSAGSTRIEFTDARHEPVGWKTDPEFDDIGWQAAVAVQSATLAASELTPRMAGPPVEILPVLAPLRVVPVPNASEPKETAFFLDFGKEIQGGLILNVTGGVAGQVVRFRSGELCLPMVKNSTEHCTGVDQDWQWIFNWTLREGAQIIEQHQYMEWRFLSASTQAIPITASFSGMANERLLVIAGGI